MRETLHWIGFVIGVIIVIGTWVSMINTIILPRLTASIITMFTWKVMYRIFLFIADRQPRYERKDRLLSALGPVSLLAALVSWMFLLLLGYALMCWPFITGNFGNALRVSGSSLFTLGIASDPAGAPTTIAFIASASGMIVIALQIGYLPTIYGAYNRRETPVTALSARAGKPLWGPEILARHHLSHATATLPALFSAWETWAADIAETHTSYPLLTVFRSPDPLHSWVVSQLAVLDAAALYLALAPSQAPPEAIQCLRAGYVGLRKLSRMVGTPVNEDPRPDDPLQLRPEQFAFGVRHMRAAGFPIERTEEEAWPDFRGWRVNYEAAAYALANFVVAVPAPWSGRRSHMTKQEAFNVLLANRPRFRTPQDVEGAAIPTVPAPQETDRRLTGASERLSLAARATARRLSCILDAPEQGTQGKRRSVQARFQAIRSPDATYRTLGWLCLVVGINQLGFGSIIPVVPTFARSFGVSQALAGLVISVYGLGRLLFDLPMGGLAERFGRRKIIIAGELITAVGSFLCAIAGSFWLLIVFRFIGGIGAATVLTGAQVVLADITTPQTRARIMNIYQGIFLCAVGLGPSIGGIVADAFGTPRAPFYAFGIMSALAGVVCFFQVPETRERALARLTASAQRAAKIGPTLRVLLRQRAFLLIGFVTFVQYFARTGALFNVVPILGQDRIGLSASATGFALSVASLMNFLTIPLSSLMMSRWGRKGAIVPSTIVCGAAFACLAVAYGYPVFFLGMFLWGLGGGVGGSAPAAYAADMAPPGANGVTMGIYLTLADAGYVFGPFLLGWFSDLAGPGTALIVTAALFAVSVALFAFFAPETVPGRARRTPTKTPLPAPTDSAGGAAAE